ncbi:hypothetical protein NE237_028628 [Protea cynaroides]|uniref:Pectinesterase inhibitor domain-containing protein n=1 Tax=Protea cynaroides TaxID=273540 RepID=A0A9Q0JU07_9MAGN|nr:hypothetical protein NE237_028628 [Protea cynaroides]
MAFQDFGQLSERRRVEKQQQLKKRITIAASVGFVLFILVASGVALVYKTRDDNAKSQNANKHQQEEHLNEAAKWNKGVKMICAPTDFREACEHSMTNMKNASNFSATRPLDLLKAAITVIVDEVEQAFHNSSKFHFSNPAEEGAFEDCKVLLADAKEELLGSITHVGSGTNMKNLPSRSHDLNNWLSAVISYQQTCIDGFPEGKLKSGMQKTLDTGKKLSSNALAIVSEVASLLSLLKASGFERRQLQEKITIPTLGGSILDEDDLPSWIPHEHRRMLKGKDDDKPKPNVVVAKDGSGQFKTISEALHAMPKKYNKRYVIYVKEGIYDETVTVKKDMVNVTIYGDGSRKTIVTGNKNFVDGVRTFQTASFGFGDSKSFLAIDDGSHKYFSWEEAGGALQGAISAMILDLIWVR